MKRILFLAVAALFAASVSAQNYRIAPLGDKVNPDGTRTYFAPQTTIYVLLTIQHESIKAGIYAPYAKRYFGIEAVQADKEIYTIIDTRIGRKSFDDKPSLAPIEPIPSATINFTNITASLSAAAAAQQAAQTIFDLRTRRIELIGGDIGENVYGEGLRAALEELARLENEYLALFYGSQTSDVQTIEYEFVPTPEQLTYILGRFTADMGVVAAIKSYGTPITMTLIPANDTTTLYPAPNPKDKKAVYKPYIVADNTAITINIGDETIGSAVIPIFQLGTEVMIAQ